MNQLLTVADVAAILQLDKHRVYRLAEAGDLPFVRVSLTASARRGSIRFRESDVEAWVDSRVNAKTGRIILPDYCKTDLRNSGNCCQIAHCPLEAGLAADVVLPVKAENRLLQAILNRLGRISNITSFIYNDLPPKLTNIQQYVAMMFGGEVCLN